MEDNKARAMTALDLLRHALPKVDDPHLTIASRIAFPLERLEIVQHTARFHASFAIEALRRALVSREDADTLGRRLGYAIEKTEIWVRSFD